MKNYPFYAHDLLGNSYEFTQSETDCGVLLTLKKENIKKISDIYALGEFTAAKTGEDGFYVIPRNLDTVADIMTKFEKRADCNYVHTLPILSFVGVKNERYTCLIRVLRSYDISFVVTVKDGIYKLEVKFNLEDEYIDPKTGLLPENIQIEIVFLDSFADHNDIAKKERLIRLNRKEIVPLSEKCKRPAVEYARKYPLVRIRQGWKQSPSSVKHQTLENEPPMHVACDFKRCRDIADECKRQGVEGAEFQLVGWNVGGHDGRFPQIFPVEEKLGGEEEFVKTVEYIKNLGYRISTHTNLQDAYEIAENFSRDDLAQDKNGDNYFVGDYGGGYAYYLCDKIQPKNAEKYYPRLASLGENGVHFTDVMSITFPHSCHNPAHPLTYKQGIELRQQMMKYHKELFGAFSSEGCVEFAIKDIDYGLYLCFGDAFGRKEIPVLSRYVRLWEVAYHGTVLYNPISATINYPLKTPEERLRLILSGGRPSMYFYSRFRTGETNWMGEIDLTCDNDDDLKRSVAYIKAALDDYKPLSRLQLVYLDRYDVFENGLEVATYANGERIVGNFSNEVKVFEGREIKPYDYILINEK